MHGDVVEATAGAPFGLVVFLVPEYGEVGAHVEQERKGVDGGVRGGVHGVDLPAGVLCDSDSSHLPLHGGGAVVENAVSVHGIRRDDVLCVHGGHGGADGDEQGREGGVCLMQDCHCSVVCVLGRRARGGGGRVGRGRRVVGCRGVPARRRR